MTPSCVCFFQSGNPLTLNQCVRFSLVRDRYQAFSVLHVTLLTDTMTAAPIRVQFFLGGRCLHDGVVKKCECSKEAGQFALTVTSHGFSSLLIRNQLVPGLHFNLTLDSLMNTYQLPHITYQGGVQMIRYIYVKDNASMWDSVIAYNYKLNKGFPYVRVPNLLCVLPQTGQEPITVPADSILKAGTGGELSEMLSRVDMANMQGEYGYYSKTNPLAAVYGIVRVKQILLDKQYVYDPDDALSFRIALGNRKLHLRTVTYTGYCGEDVEDLMNCGGLFTERVSRIVVTGDENGITTTDTFYEDDFCNSSAE